MLLKKSFRLLYLPVKISHPIPIQLSCKAKTWCQQKDIRERNRDATSRTQSNPVTKSKAQRVRRNSQQAGPCTYRCHLCKERGFQDRTQLHNHHMARHYQVGAGGSQDLPFDIDQLEPGIRECYRVNRPVILEQHKKAP